MSLELAILLLVAGLFILVLELFLPSAGTLLILAIGCILASVAVAFMVSTMLGLIFFIVVCILAVILPGIGLEMWKRSPIGRRMMLGIPGPGGTSPGDPVATAEIDDRPSSLTRSTFDYGSLRGAVGRTLTPLRPSGMTDFSGRRIDTVAEGVMIERGAYVKVVDVQGNRVIVRQFTPAEEKTWNFETE